MGKPITLSVLIKPLPADFGVSHRTSPAQASKDPSAVENSELGLEVTELTKQRAQRLGYKSGGVSVSSVRSAGIAAPAGLQEGMRSQIVFLGLFMLAGLCVAAEVERRPTRSAIAQG